ncbi:MAG: tyrosine-type recombinase/integrase [Woeseia sp.]
MDARRVQLTTAYCRDARFAPQGRQVQIRDSRLRGFYMNKGSTCKTFMCQADCVDALGRRKTVRLKIGDVELMEADDARNEARKLIASIKAGEHTKTDKPHDVTLREAWESFSKRRGAKLSKETIRSYSKALDIVLPDFLDLPLKNLSSTAAGRELVAERHEQETTDRGPYMANRAMQTLRTVYNDARRRYDGLPSMSPTALVNFNEERRYELEDGVLPQFWAALDKIENPVKRALHATLLLSGSRPGALCRLKWKNVDTERRTAFIENPKGGEKRAFELVLSRRMIEYMEAARYDDEWVFFGMKSQNSYRESSMPVPAGKLRNIYQAVAKKIHVDSLFLKLLVNHKLMDVTHGYAGQRSILLETLIAEQERISAALLPSGAKGIRRRPAEPRGDSRSRHGTSATRRCTARS